jgi:hypothetical protein
MTRIIAAAAGTALVTLFATDLQASDRRQSLRSSPHFWTEDRLRDAEPMPLPEIDPGLFQQDDLGIEDMRSSEPRRRARRPTGRGPRRRALATPLRARGR